MGRWGGGLNAQRHVGQFYSKASIHTPEERPLTVACAPRVPSCHGRAGSGRQPRRIQARDVQGRLVFRLPRGLDRESCQREVATSQMICLAGMVASEEPNSNVYALEKESERVRS